MHVGGMYVWLHSFIAFTLKVSGLLCAMPTLSQDKTMNHQELSKTGRETIARIGEDE
jgi:hypothetical protein